MQTNLPEIFAPIFYSIEVIDTVTASRGSNGVMRLATERAFEIISAASQRIPNDLKARELEIDWQRLDDLYDHLRSEYYNVNSSLLSQIAEYDLPRLRVFAERVIRDSE